MPDIDPTSAENIFLIVKDREKILFSDIAKAVSSTNERGAFDVLPRHTNFITLAREFLTVHKSDGTQTKLDLGASGVAVVKVFKNKVQVFLGVTSATK